MKAICPGTFDPITNGHLDVIERAARIFDEVVVAVAVNPDKHPRFTAKERVELIRESCRHLPNVAVTCFSGLLVEHAAEVGARVIVKGLRAVSDFEYEFQMAQMNRKLRPELETVFMTTASRYSFLSSSLVKQVARMGGDISDLVPEAVLHHMRGDAG